MASWYSKIYIFVREYRAAHPFLGYILHLLLNTFLVLQFIGMAYSYFAYILVCIYWFTSAIQITIYLIIYNSLLFMFVWSLIMTISTPVSRVPKEYYVDAETDKKLKSLTPKVGERYFPDTSTPEQILEQTKILEDYAAERNLTFIEVDHFYRLRYCYQCSLIRPDRTHHCSSCGFCVVKFDHHCPWINQCVSYRNYKYFVLYLFYSISFMVFGTLTSIEAIIRFAISSNTSETWHHFIHVVLTIILSSGFVYFPLGDLAKYHAQLVWSNETTCEQAKEPVLRGDPHASYNITPYLNYRSVFGWGLWAFPVPTFVSDGCHFHIRYSDSSDGEQYEIVPQNNTTKSLSKSQNIDMAAGDQNANVA